MGTHVLAGPRRAVSQADFDAQMAFALRVRDDISKLSGLVVRKSEPAIAELVRASNDVIQKIDALEDRMHNPKAEVAAINAMAAKLRLGFVVR